MAEEKQNSVEKPDADSRPMEQEVRPALLPEMRGEKILYTWQTSVADRKDINEDVAEAYVVVAELKALSGIIIYALYGEEWTANPYHMRPLIKQMLRDLGRQV